MKEQLAREDVLILEVAAIDPEVKAGDTVSFLFDDGNTETAVADTDGSVEAVLHQAGAFVAFNGK